MYITEKLQNVIITQLYISQQSMIVIATKKKHDCEDLH